MVFIGVTALAVMVGALVSADDTAYAVGNEPWLIINCLETEVEEGRDFRLEVVKKYSSDWPHETMRVFWYTKPITADESDYEPLNAERQSSNGHQSDNGVMGRNFHTKDDSIPEPDETFKVRFNNSVDYGTDGECIITIKDDDKVGIENLQVTSIPAKTTLPSENGKTLKGYTAGSVIEITARFNGDVTTVNPGNGERTDYAGMYILVGENRRVARLMRGDGTDTLVFGYTVQDDDLDDNGISVEGGSRGGFYRNEDSGGIGLWAMNASVPELSRLFDGLDDDGEHAVFQIVPGSPRELDDEDIPTPDPDIPFDRSTSIQMGLFDTIDGELTESGGRDWYSFDLERGEKYIIELKNAMEYAKSSEPSGIWDFRYLPGHLIDPSIIEVLNDDGGRVLGEHGKGGFVANFARAFFTPDEDGTYHIAVGGGREDPTGIGFYTLSVRQDDHADDYKTERGLVLRPGESVTGRIDSDVAPDDRRLNEWDWLESYLVDIPLFGFESHTDHDVFRFEISEAGNYELSVSDGPTGVGIWTLWRDNRLITEDYVGPVGSVTRSFEPGTYHVEVGNFRSSVGNTGRYTLSLTRMGDTD